MQAVSWSNTPRCRAATEFACATIHKAQRLRCASGGAVVEGVHSGRNWRGPPVQAEPPGSILVHMPTMGAVLDSARTASGYTSLTDVAKRDPRATRAKPGPVDRTRLSERDRRIIARAQEKLQGSVFHFDDALRALRDAVQELMPARLTARRRLPRYSLHLRRPRGGAVRGLLRRVV
jgi:hypothetical protein